jgi:choline kinase
MVNNATRNVAASKSPTNKKYSIIIPAAGQGMRMTTYGAKPLIKIKDNTTILQRQLDIIGKTFKNFEVILVAGFQADKVFNNCPHYVTKIRNEDFNETNVAHSIGMALDHVTTDRVVIVYGDLVFNKPALNCPFDNESALVLIESMKKDEVGCVIQNNKIVQMFYDLPNKWGQIAYLTGNELESFKKLTLNKYEEESSSRRLFGFEMFNKIIDEGGEFQAMIPKRAKAIDIDLSKDLQAAKTIV